MTKNLSAEDLDDIIKNLSTDDEDLDQLSSELGLGDPGLYTKPCAWFCVQDEITSRELAKIVGISEVWARRLCSRFGRKNFRHQFKINRSWAEKFAGLRAAHLKAREKLLRAKRQVHNDRHWRALRIKALDAWLALEEPRTVELSNGETLKLTVHELEVLRALPKALDAEWVPVLRALTDFRTWNNPNLGLLVQTHVNLLKLGVSDEEIREDLGHHYKRPDRFWNEKLATMIESAGILEWKVAAE